MPIATPEQYKDMLDRARTEGFAYPAINCTSSETINAAIKGLLMPVPTASSSSPPVVPNSVPACTSRTW